MQTKTKEKNSENVGTIKTESPRTGTVKQVIGAVVDVHFPLDVPEIYTALQVKTKDGKTKVLEVASHLGGNQVRSIAMETTDGLRRGVEVGST